MTKALKIKLGLTAIGLAFAASVGAAPINGSISMSGGWKPIGGTDLSNNTGIDFNAVGFVVTGTAGDLSMFVFPDIGSIADLNFSPFVGPINSFYAITKGLNTLTFDLIDVSIGNRSAINLDLSGTGNMMLTGFDATPGKWNFSAQTVGGSTFSWSSTTDVPEPGSMALLGLGLLGLAASRRFKKQ
jgi:hypothetical protein